MSRIRQKRLDTLIEFGCAAELKSKETNNPPSPRNVNSSERSNGVQVDRKMNPYKTLNRSFLIQC